MPTSLQRAAALVACCLCLAPARAAETLPQAVAAALRYFPEIEAAQHGLEAARAQVGQARAELFPSVTGQAGIGRERSRNAVARVMGEDITLSRREAELTVSQLLFDGGAALGQVRRFAARAEGAEFAVSGTMEEIALRTGQAFVEVRRLRDQLGIARESIGAHGRTLSDVTALADAGRGRRADVTQAEARRALAVSSAEQLAGQLAQAEAAFRHLTGRPPGALAPPPVLASVLPARVEHAVSQALAHHPGVRAAEKDVEAAQHDRESARARLAAPRVTLEAGGTRHRDIDGIAGPNNDQFAMLRLRYTFFRGFGESERVRETEARIEQALAVLTRVRTDVERDVRQAWEALAAGRARLPQLAQYARASADVAEAYRLQFQLGQRSLLDVLNAENERYNAISAYIGARAALAIDELRLLAAQGRLTEAVLPAPSDARTADADVQPAPRLCTDVPAGDPCLVLRMHAALPEGRDLEKPLTAEVR